MNRLPRLGELEHKSRRERFLSAWAVARKLIGVLYPQYHSLGIGYDQDRVQTHFITEISGSARLSRIAEIRN